MSDTSDEEDLSRFKEAVDNSFANNFYEPEKREQNELIHKPKSERYLEEASHYNDVKVPPEMQKRIGAKLSSIIEKKIKFVNVQSEGNLEPEGTEGGVKLFSNSSGFLSCEDVKDTYTHTHNMDSKKIKKKRRKIEGEDEVDFNGKEKLDAASVSGEYILSKEETRLWKSRRKEKVFKYRSSGNSKVLTAVE